MSLDEMRRELRRRYGLLARAILSKPYFATHSMSKREEFTGILKAEAIDRAVTGKPISLSLDGVFAVIHKSTIYATFVFDLDKIRTVAKPVLYLLSAGVTPEPRNSYYLQNWIYFYETEIVFEGTLPLTLARCGVTLYAEAKRDLKTTELAICEELPPSGFRRAVLEEYRLAQERKIYPWKLPRRPQGPPEWLGRFIHKYNKTSCYVFGLDYSAILEDTKRYPPYVYVQF